MADYSHITNAHPTYIENLYRQYRDAPEGVEESWRTFFEGFDYALNGSNGATATTSDEAPTANVDGASSESVTSIGRASHAFDVKEFSVMALIHAFRQRGHLLSDTNPIRSRRDRRPNLDLKDFQLDESDLDTAFVAGTVIGLSKEATLREILDRLKHVYAGKIGFEYSHILDRKQRRWLRDRIEKDHGADYGLSKEAKMRILDKLTDAQVFEKFLHTKYIGQKRFSLEGGEGTIPALDAIISGSAVSGAEEIVIGMAHRGRLNVLANIMGKTYEHIFKEFEGVDEPEEWHGDGDVKYHMGYSSQLDTPDGSKVHVKLIPNPSHLESVDPVVEGFTRAKADHLYDNDYNKVVPVLIHGDAAVVGQGVVYETAQMVRLEAYHTGGTIHFVINNQVGFTTDFEEARSSYYSTAAAKAIQVPVFHVNGDDPEAVVFCCKLAVDFRKEFKRDVFIDMVCYRLHGHNEGDDPKFTQPGLYENIKNHPNPREVYIQALVDDGTIKEAEAQEMRDEFWNLLQQRLDMVKEEKLDYTYQEPEIAWRKLEKNLVDPKRYFPSPETGISEERVRGILESLTTLPKGFKPLGKFNRILKSQKKAIETDRIDWALAELTAYASILQDGSHVRMSGQDVERGTFSHRHAVLRNIATEEYDKYNRLDDIPDRKGRFMIHNSHLSEYAVLGFEYGYSLATPDPLVLWEAQFGDFMNGAQIMIDQYIAAAESKWGRMSGLVMLLPHGYEGQGPEHSSARLERFLQSCAEFNMTVVNVTQPANFFHLLRRQLARPFRKPLIVMSPKSLLRHEKVVSPVADFGEGTRFQEVLDDPTAKSGEGVKRALFCSGKVYFDLLAYKEEHKRDDVAIIRLEQLYPLPTDTMDELLKKYDGAEVFWVQEEPSNMGAWQYLLAFYRNYDIQLISRKSSASPATGFKSQHEREQREIVEQAFGVG